MSEYDLELLGDDDFRDLAETAHILSELENEPGYQTFKQLVELDCRKRQDWILEGRPKDMESYRYWSGYVAGILRTLNMPERVRAIHRGELERRMPPEQEEEEADGRVFAGY